jgi:hypothetical protein
MRAKLAVGGLALALGLTGLTSPASASSSADCPWGTVNGSVVYTPALTTNLFSGSWNMSLTMTCVGTAPSAGAYSLTLSGTNTESCTSGTANGNVTGTGPLGALTGTAGYQRFGIHLYGFPPYATSTFTSGGHTFTLALWLDVLPPNTGSLACPLAAGRIVGHAAVIEP